MFFKMSLSDKWFKIGLRLLDFQIEDGILFSCPNLNIIVVSPK